mmetsp:Transcript_45394/g.69487  ORF Transcript_45394/g.69487 Transcript_45394/m.69487 type:complete len:658 (-) Transcript_45394:295-2268(-)
MSPAHLATPSIKHGHADRPQHTHKNNNSTTPKCLRKPQFLHRWLHHPSQPHWKVHPGPRPAEVESRCGRSGARAVGGGEGGSDGRVGLIAGEAPVAAARLAGAAVGAVLALVHRRRAHRPAAHAARTHVSARARRAVRHPAGAHPDVAHARLAVRVPGTQPPDVFLPARPHDAAVGVRAGAGGGAEGAVHRRRRAQPRAAVEARACVALRARRPVGRRLRAQPHVAHEGALAVGVHSAGAVDAVLAARQPHAPVARLARARQSARRPVLLGVDAHAAAAVAVGAVRVRGAHAAGAARFDAHPEVARPREAVRIRCARGSARSFPTMSRDAAIRRGTRTAGGAQGPVRVVSVCTDPATAVLAPALRVRAARRQVCTRLQAEPKIAHRALAFRALPTHIPVILACHAPPIVAHAGGALIWRRAHCALLLQATRAEDAPVRGFAGTVAPAESLVREAALLAHAVAAVAADTLRAGLALGAVCLRLEARAAEAGVAGAGVVGAALRASASLPARAAQAPVLRLALFGCVAGLAVLLLAAAPFHAPVLRHAVPILPAQHAIRLPPAASEHTPLLRHTLAALATARAILFPQRAHPSAAVFFHAMRVALAQPSLSSLLDAEPWLRIWASFLWRPALVAGDARARLADRIRRAWGSEEAFAALA